MFDQASMIIRIFALQNGVDVHYLTTKGRTKTVAHLKQELRKKLRIETNLSWAEINSLTGRRPNNRRP
jgi:hypothetical protein